MGELTGDLQAVSVLEALHSLQRLTALEVAVAGIRALQARDDELRTELRENRRKAQERERLIGAAINDAGGLPTPFSPAVGKLLAAVRAQLDSVTTFTSALLGDVVLETTLLERARFTRRLAERLGEPEVVRLCEGLEAAHAETLDWLRARLDEVADTGRSRLRPLPSQVAVALLRKAALVPVAAVQHAVRRGAAAAPGPQEGAYSQDEQAHPLTPTATGGADVRGLGTIS